MKTQKEFFKTVCGIAVPVTLQSMLQSSFSVVDQIMIGRLGSTSIAAIGLAGKFSSVFSVVVSAVAAVAGIMMAQYIGQKNRAELRRSFWVNLAIAGGIAAVFTLLCLLCPGRIMGLYTEDPETRRQAAQYLRILSVTYLPAAGTALLAALLRCMDRASRTLYASAAAATLNTVLNYVLIFGNWGAAAMGISGAAIATAAAQAANFLLLLAFSPRPAGGPARSTGAFHTRQYAAMLLPVLVCELLWSLGENVYAVIYGHLGTQALAAMTLINPIQSLMTGALCGLSQAAGVLTGKRLGAQDFDGAYRSSKTLMLYGLCGSAALSLLLLLTKSLYVGVYPVEAPVQLFATQILTAYALVAPFKIQNMILGGGILRSGGKTNDVMWIDLTGTWIFGVPLGLLAAFVWKLSIPYVYFLLSLEECVRFGISLLVFRSRRWMRRLAS